MFSVHDLIHIFYYLLSSFFSPFPPLMPNRGAAQHDGGAGSCGLITCAADEDQQAEVNEREIIF